MRSLKYTVVALTPLLGAGGFAQGLNLGMNDGLILQAQTPAQAGAMSRGGIAEPGREPAIERAGSPLNALKPDAGGPQAESLKSTRRAHAKTRTRKTEKKSHDTN